MKKYKAILFDMDGTLIPMDMDEFTGDYFKRLCVKLAGYHIDPKTLIAAVWAGSNAMVKNDGRVNNETVFWEEFEKLAGCGSVDIARDCLDFYCNEFDEVKNVCGENPLAKKAVQLAHDKAEKVVLATSPIFPYPAQITRLGWVDLEEKDFDLITSFESDYYCKPNPKYYLSICERIGVAPEDCLMIGNDEMDDMCGATEAGIDCYLVTDSLIPSDKYHFDGPRGTFGDLIELLEKM